MRFSQRIGKRSVRIELQVESIDVPLLNRLWNTILKDFIEKIPSYSFNNESELGEFYKVLWMEFFELRIDIIPSYASGLVHIEGVMSHIENFFFEVEWDQVYDFIEFIAFADYNYFKTGFIEKCNAALKKEVSGYRIIEDKVVQITSEEEILAIEEALQSSDTFKSVNTHIKTALDFIADRQSPDYRNSIKESISAVEALCNIIVKDDKATLGKALAIIEKQHNLHPSLKEAYNKIYGYTSDADGIRHAMLEDGVNLSFEDAKFMLVSCSAFINYLKAKVS